MKCCECGKEGEVIMQNGKSICFDCLDKSKLKVCVKTGNVITDPNFICDNICNDCIYMEDK